MDNLGWRKKTRAGVLLGSELTMVLAMLAATAFAQHEQAFPFSGANGAMPIGELVADGAGNLYGTTFQGGSCDLLQGCGVVFEFTPPQTPGGQWMEATIYTFKGAPDGSGPNGGLVIDKANNLYGTTQLGGNQGAGTAFALSPLSQPGGAWTETIIHSFDDSPTDGQSPLAGLVSDAAGNLYGTTVSSGSGTPQLGTAFELSPPSQPGGTWSETILYNFGAYQGDATGPGAPLIFDSAGNAYGTTAAGGAIPPGRGTVFELSPPSQAGGAWTETILHSFSAPNDGFAVSTGLTITPSGALLGTAPEGGGLNNRGVVFALAPPSSPGGTWNYALIHTFGAQPDGSTPQSRLTLLPGKNPVLYGTTQRGGALGDGTVYQLTPPAPGGTWTETPIYNFSGGSDGASPQAGVIVHDYALYGTTTEGGNTQNCSLGCGTAYRLSH